MNKILSTMLSALTAALIASPVQADTTKTSLQMISIQIAQSCGMDTNNKDLLKAVQRSPAFFAISGHIGISGRDPSGFSIPKEILDCNISPANILVKQVAFADFKKQALPKPVSPETHSAELIQPVSLKVSAESPAQQAK